MSATVVHVEITAVPAGPLAELAVIHPEMRFVWCDLDGLHYGRAPDRAPGATHVWGWASDNALFARLERSRVVAGALLRRADAGPTVTVRPLVKWRHQRDRHVCRLPDELDKLSLVTLEAPGPLELIADDSWSNRLPSM
jgi:hypothetical protein